MNKLSILKFGDTLLLCVALTLASISITGCALFSATATTEQKLADIKALTYAAASLGTSEALLENPAWRLHFATAYAQLDQLVQQKVVTGDSLRRILASLPVKELKSDRARIAIESATMLYDAVAGDKINLENQVYVLAAAEGIRNGLKAALQL